MVYLLDADSLIRAANTFYRLKRVGPFWDWLQEQGSLGNVKIPIEQYEEVTVGNKDDELVKWLKKPDVKEALLLDEEADPVTVAKVTLDGYGNLDDKGVEEVGRDPFLISYGYEDPQNRTAKAVERTAPLGALLYSLVILWFNACGHKRCRFPNRPWYERKSTASFQDMVDTLRVESLRQHFRVIPGSYRGRKKVLDAA